MIELTFGISFSLIFIAFLGMVGVIKKSPSDFPYVVILPVGVITWLVCFVIGIYRSFHIAQ